MIMQESYNRASKDAKLLSNFFNDGVNVCRCSVNSESFTPEVFLTIEWLDDFEFSNNLIDTPRVAAIQYAKWVSDISNVHHFNLYFPGQDSILISK